MNVGGALPRRPWLFGRLSRSAEAGAQVVAFLHAAHALMLRAEERARHGAVVAPGLHERVAAHLDVIAQIAVVPGRTGAHGARRRLGCPVLQPRESRRAVQRRQIDRESGGAGDGLRVGGDPDENCGLIHWDVSDLRPVPVIDSAAEDELHRAGQDAGQ